MELGSFSPPSALLVSPSSCLGAKALLALLLDISVVILYRGPGGSRVGVLALSSVLQFSFPSVLALTYLKGHALEQECPLLPPAILAFLFTTFLCILRLLLLCLHQDPPLSPCFPSSPYLGKGSSLELQGVEPNVYIVFCLCSHPVRRFEESEKNLLLYLGLSPALLFDDGGQSKDWTGGGKQWSKPGSGCRLKQLAALGR